MSLQSQMNDLIVEVKKSEFPIEIFPKPIQSYFLDANNTLDSNIDYMGSHQRP